MYEHMYKQKHHKRHFDFGLGAPETLPDHPGWFSDQIIKKSWVSMKGGWSRFMHWHASRFVVSSHMKPRTMFSVYPSLASQIPSECGHDEDGTWLSSLHCTHCTVVLEIMSKASKRVARDFAVARMIPEEFTSVVNDRRAEEVVAASTKLREIPDGCAIRCARFRIEDWANDVGTPTPGEILAISSQNMCAYVLKLRDELLRP